jgi:hypothetical protein
MVCILCKTVEVFKTAFFTRNSDFEVRKVRKWVSRGSRTICTQHFVWHGPIFQSLFCAEFAFFRFCRAPFAPRRLLGRTVRSSSRSSAAAAPKPRQEGGFLGCAGRPGRKHHQNYPSQRGRLRPFLFGPFYSCVFTTKTTRFQFSFWPVSGFLFAKFAPQIRTR